MNLDATKLARERRFRTASYTLVFLMMACVVLTLSILIHNLLPDWHANILAGLLLFIVVDRLYTYRQLKTLTLWSSEWLTAFGVQALVILIFSRFLLSYADGPGALLRDLSLLGRGYILDLFTPEFVITLMLAFAAWELTTQFLDLLDEMGLDMSLADREESAHIRGEAIPAHQRLVTLIFGTGIGLVILTALTRLNMRSILSSSGGFPPVQLSRFSGGEAGALLYFIFGLALLSLSRLMSLQTQWNRLHVPVSSPNLPRQWVTYSLFFLLALAFLTSLLPAGDSFGLFSVLAMLLTFILSIFVFLAQIVVALVLLLFSLPFLLLGRPAPLITRSVSPVLPTLPAPTDYAMTSSALWELVKSILLWGSLAGILIFALVHFVRQHDELLAALRRSRITNWLLLAWQWLYRNVEKTGEGISRALAEGWKSIASRWEGKRILSTPNWISVRLLEPRRRIYFFYLAMVRRSAEQGLPRSPSQTPAEYAAKLQNALPTAGQDIESITEAFIQARYSRQPVDVTQANLVKATWERIRRALQSKAKREKS
jgi:hypothetical protein